MHVNMCCQLNLVSVTKAEACVGLFVYLCYRMEESWVHHLVLNSMKAPAGRTDTNTSSYICSPQERHHEWEEGVNGL